MSRATADRQLTLLKSFFNRAVEWEKIPASPAKFLKKDTSQHRQKDRWLTKEEIHELLKVCDADLRRVVIVAINTGLRKHNLVILEPADIRGVEGTIKVRKTKSNHEYYAYLNDELRDLFKEIPMAPNVPILNTRNLDRRFRRAVKASKIASCTLHDLRHTFAYVVSLVMWCLCRCSCRVLAFVVEGMSFIPVSRTPKKFMLVVSTS